MAAEPDDLVGAGAPVQAAVRVRTALAPAAPTSVRRRTVLSCIL